MQSARGSYESIQRFAQTRHGKRLFHYIKQSDMFRPRPVEKAISLILNEVANQHYVIEGPCPAHCLKMEELLKIGSEIIMKKQIE